MNRFSEKSHISEKKVVYHECDDGNCVLVEPGESALRLIISGSKMKCTISMEYELCNYLGWEISRTKISGIIIGYVPLVITVNASGIDDSTVDYKLGVILDNNTYFPNYIMTVRVDEVVPDFNTFTVTTKNNDYVIEYGNDVCLHDVTEMFVREAEFILNCCED